MKKLDKIILAIFSVLIFLQSILIICVIAGFVDISTISKFAGIALSQERTKLLILAVTIICLLCSIKSIFFESSDSDKNKNKGILMQNDNGKLLISKPTIENIVVSSVQGFTGIEDVSVSTDLDNYNNLIINVNLVVSNKVIIKELTLNLQNKIKEAIKRTSDLDVKEVNVKIKNIVTEQENNE